MGRLWCSAVVVAGLLAAPAGASASSLATAYVANRAGGTVTPVDLERATAGRPIDLGAGSAPAAVVFGPDARTAYVATASPPALVAIDVAGDAPRHAIPLEAGVPAAVATSPGGTTAYVSTGASVTPVDLVAGRAGAPITVLGGAGAIALTPDGRTAYVANPMGASVTPVHTATGSARAAIPLGGGAMPSGLAMAPDGGRLYAADAATGRIVVVDVATDAVVGAYPVPAGPVGVAISPGGEALYTASPSTDLVTRIDLPAGTVRPPRAVPGGPVAPAVVPGFGLVVANRDAGQVTLLPSGLETGGIGVGVGPGPGAVAVAPDQAPTAAVTTFGVAAGTGALLDGSASRTPVGAVTSYRWEFGDGQSAHTPGPYVSHTYAAAGVYPVRLTVANSAGTSLGRVFTGQAVSNLGGPSATTASSIAIRPPLPYRGAEPPSNSFRFPMVKRQADGTLRFTFLGYGPGRLRTRVTGQRGGRAVTYGTREVRPTRVSAVTYHLRPTKAGRALLRSGWKRHARTRLTALVTWTPAGVAPRTLKRVITLRTDRGKGRSLQP